LSMKRLSGSAAAEAFEEALTGMKSARLQLGTFSHLSGDMGEYLAPLRRAAESATSFLSRRGNALMVSAVFISCAGLLDLARGWMRMRSRIPG